MSGLLIEGVCYFFCTENASPCSCGCVCRRSAPAEPVQCRAGIKTTWETLSEQTAFFLSVFMKRILKPRQFFPVFFLYAISNDFYLNNWCLTSYCHFLLFFYLGESNYSITGFSLRGPTWGLSFQRTFLTC